MKVGDYVRTGDGIRKIVSIEKDEGYKPRVKVIVFDRYIENVRHFGYKFYTDENIIKKSKSSPNIIDLIEVGDYVNGECVINVDSIEVYTRDGMYLNEDIKSIVTKEQFSQIEYKIGG